MKQRLALALLLLATAIPAAALNRSAEIKLAGTVQNVVTISTYTSDLIGSGNFTVVYLDLRTGSAGTNPQGQPIWITVRVNCSAYLVDCRNLRIGDAVRVTASFSGQNSGSISDPTPMHISAPIEYQ